VKISAAASINAMTLFS